ncbi:serine/threonine-protein kinase [Chamaesiphon minutus]|uniref:non-specific serine/threonine protein kinase n=1 Tax=Chamaesiphon minutus (strain ATCC 27169 / PCC 6605) TaxID=1173020 RepID=K9UFJ3_CHAP6|nr:serine/threonine-protein kinase [Chamaesiphon minutus]AFY93418.1 protein kinase family protein,pentapeptide repeat protein [Chamaesiphon minutus PCC 6605]
MNQHNQNLLDLSPQGYQIDRVLGQNIHGGRVTYLAQEIDRDLPVVIKQFQFATTGNTWGDYDAYQREVDILRQLNHPHIPKYLTSWETPTGFCLVQEYKSGITLANSGREFTLDKVKQIAIEILEVLIYLQQQHPPIIHRDLKPENILIDDRDVYIIDFGFARSNNTDLTASSTIKGTLGFMPPEQLFNRPLTKAADLYSLGVTLVCLLTGMKSTEIDRLIDHNYRLDLPKHLSHLPLKFLAWLMKMTDPNPESRYPDAQTALTALQTLDSSIESPMSKPKLIGLGLIVLIGLSVIHKYIPTGHRSIPSSGNTISISQLQAEKGCPGCNLVGINLRGQNLQSYDFTGANLSGADLRDTDLRGASLRGANLTGAMWVGANLSSTDLRDANLPAGKVHKSDRLRFES